MFIALVSSRRFFAPAERNRCSVNSTASILQSFGTNYVSVRLHNKAIDTHSCEDQSEMHNAESVRQPRVGLWQSWENGSFSPSATLKELRQVC